MKKEMKQVLKAAFEAPPPKGKQAFLQRLQNQMYDTAPTGVTGFLLTQAGYISKWIWLSSLAAFLTAVTAGIYIPENTLWILSAVMPLMAVTAVMETVRSAIYGMAELEQASRYCLRSILLARMEIIGSVHFLLFCLGTVLVQAEGNRAVWQSAVYLFVPYLLTTGGSLALLRCVRGREAAYVAAALAIAVAAFPELFQYRREILYAAENFKWWLALFFLLTGFNAVQYKKTINYTEEILWNSK